MPRQSPTPGDTTSPPIALIYCRVSTKSQEEEGTSLQSQETANVAYAHAHGYTVGRITHEVYSGAELYDRPKLTQERAAIRAGQFQAMIVYAIDRLSRDPIHLEILAEECERYHCALLFVTEPLENSDEGRLLRYVKGYSSKKERAAIRERSMRGRFTRATQGKIHNAGVDLYGYRRDRERAVRVIYEPEAQIIREIFALCAQGVSAMRIARDLNARGVPPPSVGKQVYQDRPAPVWYTTTVTRLIANEVYKGEAWAWHYTNTHKKQTGESTLRPREEWIRLPPDTSPAIVTPEEWDEAHNSRRQRAAIHVTRNLLRPFLLRGRIRCERCGLACCPSFESNRKNPALEHHSTYRCCSFSSVRGYCGARRVRAERVEAWVWAQVSAALRNPEIIAAELRRLEQDGPDEVLLRDRDTAKREIARRERKAAELLRRFSEADDESRSGVSAFPWELVEREVTRLTAEKQNWETTLRDIERRLQSRALVADQLHALHTYCERVAQRLDQLTFEERRLAIEALDITVTVDGAQWALSGNIPIAAVSQPALFAAVSAEETRLFLPQSSL